MASRGQRAIPSVGEDLNRRLTEIGSGLSHPAAEQLKADALESAAREVETELSAWAGKALLHHAEGEREMKEIIAALARTAESVAARDEKYSTEIGGLNWRKTARHCRQATWRDAALRHRKRKRSQNLCGKNGRGQTEVRISFVGAGGRIPRATARLGTLSALDPLTDFGEPPGHLRNPAATESRSASPSR